MEVERNCLRLSFKRSVQISDKVIRLHEVFDMLNGTIGWPGSVGVELMMAHSHLGEHSGSGIGKKQQ